ncbi:MAG TPA: glycosyltransferase [Nitrospirae bacterium]|nr:glycosyl transferase family 2 [bacterium BMS3Bbin08]HDK16655.1 glycosyltransferase [Nitrospirota bacterium]
MKKAPNDIEFIVGIPSYMEADRIAFVVREVDKGITRYFSKLNSVIVNVDNHSGDNTKEAFLSTGTLTPRHYITTPKGVRGKGNNFLNLFRFAQKYAGTLKAVVVFDADLRSITPEWVNYLGKPVMDGFDYVLPVYSRHQFDGTITNHICYPLLYSLLGEDIRQPIGGEFAFSPSLMKYWLKQEWDTNVRHYGVDIFMTLHAILGGFKICEAGLGTKVHKASAPKLGPMFSQVVTTLFNLILAKKTCWISSHVESPKPKPRFGLKNLGLPQELKIDIRDLKEQLRGEYMQRRKLLKKHLNEYSVLSLESMFEQDFYSMDILMWTQVVFQLLSSFQKGSKKVKRDIIEALKPLYFCRSVTFDYKTWRYDSKHVEGLLKSQAKAFASQKPYFLGLYLHKTTGRQARQ